MRNLVLTILLTFTSFLRADDTLHEYVQEGKKHMREGSYLRAIQDFSSAAGLIERSGDFSNLSPYTYRGNIYYLVSDYHRAVADYTFVIEHVSPEEKEQTKELISALSGRCLSYGLLDQETECNRDFRRLADLLAQDGFEKEYRQFLQALSLLSTDTDECDCEDDDDDDDDDEPFLWLLKSL